MKPKNKFSKFNASAVFVVKTAGILVQGFTVTIEDGVVTDVVELTRAPDVPAAAIGRCNSDLWRQYHEKTNSIPPSNKTV